MVVWDSAVGISCLHWKCTHARPWCEGSKFPITFVDCAQVTFTWWAPNVYNEEMLWSIIATVTGSSAGCFPFEQMQTSFVFVFLFFGNLWLLLLVLWVGSDRDVHLPASEQICCKCDSLISTPELWQCSACEYTLSLALGFSPVEALW
jgi:hypothetical protein